MVRRSQRIGGEAGEGAVYALRSPFATDLAECWSWQMWETKESLLAVMGLGLLCRRGLTGEGWCILRWVGGSSKLSGRRRCAQDGISTVEGAGRGPRRTISDFRQGRTFGNIHLDELFWCKNEGCYFLGKPVRWSPNAGGLIPEREFVLRCVKGALKPPVGS